MAVNRYYEDQIQCVMDELEKQFQQLDIMLQNVTTESAHRGELLQVERRENERLQAEVRKWKDICRVQRCNSSVVGSEYVKTIDALRMRRPFVLSFKHRLVLRSENLRQQRICREILRAGERQDHGQQVVAAIDTRNEPIEAAADLSDGGA